MSYLATLARDEDGSYIRHTQGTDIPILLGETGADAIRNFMGWCGCGMPEETLGFLCDVLEYFGRERAIPFTHEAYERDKALESKAFRTTDQALQYFIRYCLDAKDLIEHGTSIPGAWLTDIGKSILEDLRVLRAKGELGAIDVETTA